MPSFFLLWWAISVIQSVYNACITEDKVDSRFTQLQQWVAQHQLDAASLAPASADASFRRYFRLQTDSGSLIVMDAPPDKENSEPFVRIGRMLFDIGIHVPEIIEVDLQQGFILLSDLGKRDYLSSLNAQTVDQLYGDAMRSLLTLQQRASHDLPPYDEALLRREMALFTDWYLGTHRQVQLSDAQSAVIQSAFDLLVENALAQPRVCVHRDYHSRNLMFCADNNPGVLDFQDAVYGPITYDLVSLLRDCYIEWPLAQVQSWVKAYAQQLREAGMITDVSDETFLRWFDLMGIQRHLKATGIFARLNHRDGKPRYLNDIPRTMGYVYKVASQYAELQVFVELLQQLGVEGQPLESLSAEA